MKRKKKAIDLLKNALQNDIADMFGLSD